MSNARQTIKRLTPAWLLKPILYPYHYGRAVAANAVHGLPARGMNVIAVTGTNGKTTTVNYIASILMAAGYKVGVSTTAVFRIGDKQWDNELNMTVTNPFALQKLLKQMKRARVQWVVLEVTSHSLHQRRVMGIPVHTAVMTNLSQDHLDYHGTMQSYAAAKARLLKRARKNIILNCDDDWFEFYQKLVGDRTLFTYGTGEKNDIRITKANLGAQGSKVSVNYGVEKLVLNLKLAGKFNVYNALAAAATALALSVKPEAVKVGLETLANVPGRMEAIECGQSFVAIVDYAHTPDAMENVFETLRPLTTGKLIAVFGSAGDRDRRKRPLMGQIAAEHCDVAIVTDDEPHSEEAGQIRKSILKGANHTHSKAKIIEIAERAAALKAAFAMAKRGDTVVILGMGHQKYRAMNEGKIEWDDREVARSLLKK